MFLPFADRFVFALFLAKMAKNIFIGCYTTWVFSGIDLQPWISSDGFLDVSQENLMGNESEQSPFKPLTMRILAAQGKKLCFLLFISVAVGMVYLYLCSRFSQGLSKGQQCGRTLWGSCAMAPKSRSKSLARAETQKKALKKAVRSHRDNWD